MRGLILLLVAGPVAALRVFPRPHLVRTSKLRLCAADNNELDAADVSGLYASLQKRRSQLTSRADAAVRERALIAELAEAWPPLMLETRVAAQLVAAQLVSPPPRPATARAPCSCSVAG